MKKILTCLLATLGMTTACGQAQMNATYEVDEFRTKNDKTVKIHALVHASIWIEAGDIQIYVDPVTKSGNRQIDYSALPKADFILITHEHFDHLDKDAIRQLTKDGTQLIMNPAGAKAFGKGQSIANGDKLQLKDDVSVEAVPAYNTTKGHTQFHPKGRDNGYILTIDGLRIYIAGDTEDIDEMASISGIDIAFLPCNQPYTMTPYDTVYVGFPIWWGICPRIINSWLDNNEPQLQGKVLIPFATSGSSGIEEAEAYLKKTYPSLNWQKGLLLNNH